MAERGRKPGFRMPEEHRSKIKSTQILNALSEHALGQREMGSTQVTAAIALLKKVLPDLAAVELSGEVKTNYALSDRLPSEEEWAREHANSTAH